MLQGFSAAVVWTVGLALLVDTVGHEHIGKAMGYVFIALSLAFPIAPILGGVVYDRGGYYAVYYMAFGLIAFDILLRVLLIEKKVASQWLDEPGPADSIVQDPDARGSRSEAQGTKEPQPQEQNVTRRSSKWSSRLPPVLTLLKSRRLLSALWCSLVQAGIYAGLESVLPLFVSRTFGWTSTGGGLIFLAQVAPSFLGPVVGWASDTYGPRYLATSGFIFSLPPLVCLRFVTENTIEHKVLLCALLALDGLGLTLVLGPILAEITYMVEAKEKKHPGIFGSKGAYAQAYGLFNVSFAGGTMVGPLWAGLIERAAGWKTMSWTLGLLCVTAALPAWLFTGGFITRPDLSQREMSEKRKREAASSTSA
jgi:MFS family permease